MEQRRLGRLEHLSSVLIYGAAALAQVSQDVTEARLQAAPYAGINHFDVAASYGDTELRLRPWAGRLGPQAFVATKTGERDREAAWSQVNASLQRLGVDRVALLQLHAVGDLDDLDRATATGGALAAAVRAREEGLVSAIGISGHGHHAPATHLEALRRIPFDTVLWKYVLATDAGYAAGFGALLQACAEADVGLMTIKTVARRNWPGGADRADRADRADGADGADGGDQTYATWYEPWDDPEHLGAAVAFALRQPRVTGIATAGDVRLLDRIVSAAQTAGSITDDAIDEVLGRTNGYSSSFLSMPW